MSQRDVIETLTPPVQLMQDEYYYRFIFKKTEKIVCSVFYILSINPVDKDKQMVVDDLKTAALDVLSFVGETLTHTTAETTMPMRVLRHRLVLLESKLRLLHAVQVVPQTHLNVFVAEIDSLLRSVASYEQSSASANTTEAPARTSGVPAAKTKTAPRTRASVKERTGGTDRRERILAVLEAQPQATIKDISDTVDDCSEKTIQRELNDMIDKGDVVREGERRWSRYSLAN